MEKIITFYVKNQNIMFDTFRIFFLAIYFCELWKNQNELVPNDHDLCFILKRKLESDSSDR